jgi:hypothetical protein
VAKMGRMVATVGLVSAVAATLSACSVSSDPDEIGVCHHPVTMERIDDDKCDPDGNDRNGAIWFYYSANNGHSAPPVGQKVTKSHGSYKPTSSNYQRGGVPSSGSVISKSTISRGGFGAGGVKGSSGG